MAYFGIASLAFHPAADSRSPSLLAQDPSPHHPGRIVADVLAMSAFESRYPMHLFVLMEVHYPPLHRMPLSNIQ